MKNITICSVNRESTAEAIRREIRRKGLTPGDVCDLLGIYGDEGSARKWCYGLEVPSTRRLYQLAWVLDTSVDSLIVGSREALGYDPSRIAAPVYAGVVTVPKLSERAFGYALCTLCINANLSAAELADRIGVSRQMVYRWQNGKAVPKLGKLYAMSLVFNVPVDALLDGDRVLLNRSDYGKTTPTALAGNGDDAVGVVLFAVDYGCILAITASRRSIAVVRKF